MNHLLEFREGEELITIVRRHWFHLAIEGVVTLGVFILVSLGAVIMIMILAGGDVFLQIQQVVALSLYALSVLALFLWLRFFASWSDHWLDAWIITNKRIIDIEQHGFFRRTVSSFPLDRIQDVTYDVSGVIATWLHFGDVRIQTASISDDLIMRQVPFPADIKEHLMEMIPAKRW